MSPVAHSATVSSRGHARCVRLVQTLWSVLPCLLWPCPAAHRARRMQSKDAFHRVQWRPVTQWRPRSATERQTIMPEQNSLWILNQHTNVQQKSLFTKLVRFLLSSVDYLVVHVFPARMREIVYSVLLTASYEGSVTTTVILTDGADARHIFYWNTCMMLRSSVNVVQFQWFFFRSRSNLTSSSWCYNLQTTTQLM